MSSACPSRADGGDAVARTRTRGVRRAALGAAAPLVAAALLAANSLSFHSRIAAGVADRSSDPLPADPDRAPPLWREEGSKAKASLPCDRGVPFVRFAWNPPTNASEPGADAYQGDAFSAAWWQRTDRVVGMNLFETIGKNPEWASLAVFNKGRGNIRMTRDWLDLSVEHMSKWWKVILRQHKRGEEGLVKSLEDRIVSILKRYVRSRDRREFFRSLPADEDGAEDASTIATRSTLVVIAYMADPSEKGVWSLAATIMSLIQVEMGRIVVASHLPSDGDLVRRSFAIVDEAISTWDAANATSTTPDWPRRPSTELEYCFLRNATYTHRGIEGFNIPSASLRTLRRVLTNRTSRDEASCWLGAATEASRWRYTFLAEPDLLLVTKPDALPGLGRALRDGGILAPHRLQPLPHGSDFAGVEGVEGGTHAIPHAPPFEEVIELDAYASRADGASGAFDSCCDRGAYRPHLAHERCPLWWSCGLVAMRKPDAVEAPDGVARVMMAHKRLLGYRLMRLRRGTAWCSLARTRARRVVLRGAVAWTKAAATVAGEGAIGIELDGLSPSSRDGHYNPWTDGTWKEV